MTEWSDKFNDLPHEVRHIAAMVYTEAHIRHLKEEKERLERRYRQSCREINEHIKNLEDWLRKHKD